MITFYRNGKSLGTAFTNVRTMRPTLAYFPAVSLSQGERCDLNFGGKPLLYPVDGYKPMQQEPPEAFQQWGQYIMSCWGRLVSLLTEDAETKALQAAAKRQWQPGHVIDWRNNPFRGMPESAAMKLLKSGDANLIAGMLAPFLPPLFDNEWHLHATILPWFLQLHSYEPPHNQEAVTCMLSLMERCMADQAFRKAIGSLVRGLAWYGSMTPFRRCSLQPDVSDDIKGQAPALLPPEVSMQYSGSYPYTSMMVTLLKQEGAKLAWLNNSTWMLHLEGLLTRKLPTMDDLKQLIPTVTLKMPTHHDFDHDAAAHTGRPHAALSDSGNDMMVASTSADQPAGDAETMQVDISDGNYKAAVGDLGRAIINMETNHLLVAAAVAKQLPVNAHAATPLPASAGVEQTDNPLVIFIRHVLQRNKGIMQRIPPPGLSDATVLTTTFFLLLRLLQPYVEGERKSFSMTHFPAAAMFVLGHVADAMQVAHDVAMGRNPPKPNRDHPMYELLRVGGLITHLQREVPVPTKELARLVEVQLPRPQKEPKQAQPRKGTSQEDETERLINWPTARMHEYKPLSDTPQPNPRPATAQIKLPDLPDDHLPELVNAVLMLYGWRISGSLQSGQNMAAVMGVNLEGLNEVTGLQEPRQGTRAGGSRRPRAGSSFREHRGQGEPAPATAAGAAEATAPGSRPPGYQAAAQAGPSTAVTARSAAPAPERAVARSRRHDGAALSRAKTMLQEELASNVRCVCLHVT